MLRAEIATLRAQQTQPTDPANRDSGS